VVFLERARVHDHDFLELLQALELAGGDAGGAVVVLDELAEGLEGTLTPLKSSRPACFQPAQPPSRRETSV
jgi:hypothetical protein